MNRIRAIIAASALALGAGLALAAPAQAAADSPLDTSRTLSVQVNARPDSGKGTPTDWAKDTFKRNLTIKTEPISQDAEAKTVPTTPTEQLCAWVGEHKLTQKYTMTGVDAGTFETISDSATGSPGAGAPLVKGAKGEFKGGFTATFEAPAFWCTYSGKVSAEQATNTGSSGYPALLFDGAASVDLTKWQWTYTRCAGKAYTEASAEKWTNGKDGNSGDVLGKACVKAPVSTTPPATPPATVGPKPSELPLTGPGDGVNPLAILLPIAFVLVAGGTGAVLMRRRRDNPTFSAE